MLLGSLVFLFYLYSFGEERKDSFTNVPLCGRGVGKFIPPLLDGHVEFAYTLL